jgi:hypothetical protein
MIDKDIVNEYLQMVDLEILELNKFELIDIILSDQNKFNEIENQQRNIILI